MLKQRSRPIVSLWRLAGWLLLLLVGFTAVSWTLAQTADEGWSAPENLSRSGAAAQPQLVVDDNGRFHLWWPDSFAGLTYLNGRPGQWGNPAPVADLPFAEASPTFLADGLRLHAFWQEQVEADRLAGTPAFARLRHSSAAAADAANPAAWSPAQTVQTEVLALAVAGGGDGRLHLATLRADATAAGLYYQQSPDAGLTWESPIPLYQSDYLRLLSPAEANVQIAAQGDALWIVRDDRLRQSIFLHHSANGGQTWAEPQPIGETDAAQAPSRARLARAADSLHLLWQVGQTGAGCALQHQWLADGAADWSPALPLPPGLPDCPSEYDLVADGPALFLLSRVADRSYLQGWQDGRWQAPQPQPALDSATAPDFNHPVAFTCGRAAQIQAGQLWVAACGAAIGQDVWLLGRPLAPLRQSLQETPVWRDPAVLTAPDAALFHPALVADSNGRFHAIWSQADPGSQTATALYYARWDPAAAGWSRATAIVSAAAGQQATEPALTIANDQLYLVWRGGAQGEIFFSQADANRAANPSDWSTPLALPMPQPAGSAPDILVDGAGGIHVAYALPLNEDRGIYLTSSADGNVWTPPSQIFDAVAAGWPQVDAPRLALTGYDTLHALWLRRDLPGSLTPATLHYAAAGPDGRWSAPQAVTTGTTAVGAISGAQLLGWGERLLHRLWLQSEGGAARQALWHQVSLDSGLTWSRAGRVGGLGRAAAAADLLLDGAGQPYLLSLTTGEGGEARPALDLWRWADDRWQSETGLTLVGGPPAGRTALAGALATDGRLGAIYLGQTVADGQAALLFAARQVAPPETLPTPLPSLTPTPTATPTVTPTPAPQPTPTLSFALEPDTALPLAGLLPGTSAGALVLPAALSLSLAGLLVVAVVIFGRRQRRRR